MIFVGKHSCDPKVVEGSSIFGLGLSLAGVKESSEFKKPSVLVLWGIVFFSTHSIIRPVALGLTASLGWLKRTQLYCALLQDFLLSPKAF